MHHDQKVRYARNISLPELGEAGQEKLLKAKVLVVGAGGLGSPLLLYLASAGVGKIGIIDDDKVALSNLQRQIIHESEDVGRAKVLSAKDAINDLNPEVKISLYDERLTPYNIDPIIENYDIVADCCDNFETRFLVNAACFKHKKTLVSAAIIGFSGQLYSFKPYLGGNNPCYQCIVPDLPPADATPKCSESGVLGALGGVMGSMQALEVIKEICDIGQSLSGYMIVFDGLSNSIRKVKVKPDRSCKQCGEVKGAEN